MSNYITNLDSKEEETWWEEAQKNKYVEIIRRLGKPSNRATELVKLINSMIAIKYIDNVENEIKLALAFDKILKKK